MRVTFESSSSNPTILNTNRTSTFFSASAGIEVLAQLVSSDSAAPASSVQSNCISPQANMESQIGFSTATSSGNRVHRALPSQPFLANSNNSSLNQDTSFHISNSNPSWRFLPNQQILDPSASATLGSASYQKPISMSTCFQKSVPKLQATKLDGNTLEWMKWLSICQATIDRLPMSLSEKMIHLQSLLSGEATSLIDGYGCNGSLYVPVLNRLEKHFGNPKRIVNAFLEKLSQFKPPNLTVPESYTQFSAFLITLVDTFQQLGFNHDIHSTTNLNQALNKFSTPVRLDWNKYILENCSVQPSLKDLSDWLSIYAKACRDLPAPISVTRPSHGRSKFAHKLRIQKTQSPLPSSTRTTRNGQQEGSFSDGNKQGPSKTVVCPSNETCQYLYKCSFFQTLSPFDRREHVKNLKLCFNCFGSHHVQHCNSKNVCRTGNCGQKHHNVLHESFGDNNQRVKPPSVAKCVQLHGTGQVAIVPVEFSNGKKTPDTYAYLENGSCQSLLLTSAASE